MPWKPDIDGALVRIVREHLTNGRADGTWLVQFCNDVSGDLFALKDSMLQIVKDDASGHEAMNLQLQVTVKKNVLKQINRQIKRIIFNDAKLRLSIWKEQVQVHLLNDDVMNAVHQKTAALTVDLEQQLALANGAHVHLASTSAHLADALERAGALESKLMIAEAEMIAQHEVAANLETQLAEALRKNDQLLQEKRVAAIPEARAAGVAQARAFAAQFSEHPRLFQGQTCILVGADDPGMEGALVTLEHLHYDGESFIVTLDSDTSHPKRRFGMHPTQLKPIGEGVNPARASYASDNASIRAAVSAFLESAAMSLDPASRINVETVITQLSKAYVKLKADHAKAEEGLLRQESLLALTGKEKAQAKALAEKAQRNVLQADARTASHAELTSKYSTLIEQAEAREQSAKAAKGRDEASIRRLESALASMESRLCSVEGESQDAIGTYQEAEAEWGVHNAATRAQASRMEGDLRASCSYNSKLQERLQTAELANAQLRTSMAKVLDRYASTETEKAKLAADNRSMGNFLTHAESEKVALYEDLGSLRGLLDTSEKERAMAQSVMAATSQEMDRITENVLASSRKAEVSSGEFLELSGSLNHEAGLLGSAGFGSTGFGGAGFCGGAGVSFRELDRGDSDGVIDRVEWEGASVKASDIRRAAALESELSTLQARRGPDPERNMAQMRAKWSPKKSIRLPWTSPTSISKDLMAQQMAVVKQAEQRYHRAGLGRDADAALQAKLELRLARSTAHAAYRSF